MDCAGFAGGLEAMNRVAGAVVVVVPVDAEAVVAVVAIKVAHPSHYICTIRMPLSRI